MAYRFSISITDENTYEYMKQLPNISKDIQEKYQQEQEQTNKNQYQLTLTQTKQHQGINTIITFFGLAALFIGVTLITTHHTYLYLGVFFTVEGFIATIIGLLGIRENQKTLKQHAQEATI